MHISAEDITEISLEMPGGYWEGPVYKIDFYADGSCIYRVKSPVDKAGVFEGEFDDFEKLAELIIKLGFFEMEDVYESGVIDGSTWIYSAVENGKRKIITDTTQSAIMELWSFGKSYFKRHRRN